MRQEKGVWGKDEAFHSCWNSVCLWVPMCPVHEAGSRIHSELTTETFFPVPPLPIQIHWCWSPPCQEPAENEFVVFICFLETALRIAQQLLVTRLEKCLVFSLCYRKKNLIATTVWRLNTGFVAVLDLNLVVGLHLESGISLQLKAGFRNELKGGTFVLSWCPRSALHKQQRALPAGEPDL